MPKSKVHIKINFTLLIPLAIFGYFFYPNVSTIIIGCTCYAVATRWFNPDADIINQSKILSFKGILTLPLRICYAPFFKHRGVSHTLFGTVTRMIAVIIFFYIVLFLYFMSWKFITSGFFSNLDFMQVSVQTTETSKYFLESFASFVTTHKAWSISALIGVFIADLLHILSDRIL
ncbi:MAG: DUF2227 family putative metal-binding protein [Bacteriovoracaceae bacterium]|nr:DUF2227 family putative metal-binding protein [Bacteriovoracaceae bacterium]